MAVTRNTRNCKRNPTKNRVGSSSTFYLLHWLDGWLSLSFIFMYVFMLMDAERDGEERSFLWRYCSAVVVGFVLCFTAAEERPKWRKSRRRLLSLLEPKCERQRWSTRAMRWLPKYKYRKEEKRCGRKKKGGWGGEWARESVSEVWKGGRWRWRTRDVMYIVVEKSE